MEIRTSIPVETKRQENVTLGRAFCAELHGLLQTRSSVRFARSPEIAEIFPSGPREIRDVEYDEGILSFRGGSAHHVFGALVSFETTDGKVIKKPCAIKKHSIEKSGIPKGQVEFENTERIKALGLRTVTPLCLIMGKGSECFIITLFDDRLQVGSSINFQSEKGQENAELGTFLVDVAQYIARLHLAGIFHHDLQLKNLARDKMTGEIFGFDWENTSFSKSTFLEMPEDFFRKCQKGLECFLTASYRDKDSRSLLSDYSSEESPPKKDSKNQKKRSFQEKVTVWYNFVNLFLSEYLQELNEARPDLKRMSPILIKNLLFAYEKMVGVRIPQRGLRV